MTAIGLVWLIFSLYAVQNSKKMAVAALMVSATFQASSFANIGEKGVSLFLVTQLIIILRYSPSIISTLKTGVVRNQLSYLFLFIVYSSVISYASPSIFYNTRVINDANSAINGGVNAEISAYSLIYMTSFILNMLTFLALTSKKYAMDSNDSINAILISAVVVSIFGFIETSMKLSGDYEVLRNLVFNNIGYKQALFADQYGNFRLQGGFSEPSYCGAFLGKVRTSS